MDIIDKRIINRTRRAIRDLPLNATFYQDVKQSGLEARKVFALKSKYLASESIWFKSSENIESAFRWLISIGVLRREVDGQGLTAKVRLTPLGRQILEIYPGLPSQKALIVERIRNWVLRRILFQ